MGLRIGAGSWLTRKPARWSGCGVRFCTARGVSSRLLGRESGRHEGKTTHAEEHSVDLNVSSLGDRILGIGRGKRTAEPKRADLQRPAIGFYSAAAGNER